MSIHILSWMGYLSNSYVLHNGKDAYIVDASLDLDKHLSMLAQNGLTLKGILLTHGHFDHICTTDKLREATGAPVYIHELDAELLGDSYKNADALFSRGDLKISDADFLLKDGDILRLGNDEIKVIHTPGHTRGSVCYDAGSFMLTGDTLFSDSFGRYDLYGGDLPTLKASLSKLASLAKTDDKPIYCGHNENSTLKSATDYIKQFLDI